MIGRDLFSARPRNSIDREVTVADALGLGVHVSHPDKPVQTAGQSVVIDMIADVRFESL